MTVSIIFMVVLIVIGLLLLYRAVADRLLSQKARRWPVVKGKILTSEPEEDRARTATGVVAIAFIPKITYEYTVNGEKLTGNRVTIGRSAYSYITASQISEKFAVGTEPDVYYNPANPAESVLVPKSREGQRSLIPGIFIIATGILVGLIGILYPV